MYTITHQDGTATTFRVDAREIRGLLLDADIVETSFDRGFFIGDTPSYITLPNGLVRGFANSDLINKRRLDLRFHFKRHIRNDRQG